jgi:cyclophilin family peptidyl-prolyl cis-trans isomerase
MRRIALSLFAVLAFTVATTPSRAADDKGGSNVVVLETTLGNVELTLDAEKAPVTVENFLGYVDAGHYDGTLFHRVIPGFMIQGGGFDASFQQKATRGPIKNEFGNGLTNQRGTISMARTSDPHSATSQFFINVVDNAFLNQGDGYAVFGKVTAGMDVVDKIAAVKTGRKGPFSQDAPQDDVKITKARRK